MNQILDPPNEYDAGLDFDYSVWNMNSEITLVNVPWNADYRDIVSMTQLELDAYIDARENATTHIKVQYIRIDQPIKLDIPFAASFKYNYIRVRNQAQPGVPGDIPRTYYYFITDIRYNAPRTTQVMVQLDVWQTFGRNVEFGRSFIERGHIGIANENQFDDFGRKYLTIPEGIDGGSDYVIASTSTEIIMAAPNNYDILVASTIDLEADGGTPAAPVVNSAKGSFFQGMPSGASLYVFDTVSSFTSFMASITSKAWVSNGIISVTTIPNIQRWLPTFTFNPSGQPTPVPSDFALMNSLNHEMRANWRENFKNAFIPERYRHLLKFLTFPYLAVEMTAYTGTPVLLRPENWNDEDANLTEVTSLLPPNQRTVIYPDNYNARTTGGADEGIDVATVIANYPTVAVVNNQSSMFMAANRNSLAYAAQSADWSQQKALLGNQLAYDQATAGTALMEEMAMTQRNADIAQTALSNRLAAEGAIFNGLYGIGSGAGTGLVGGPAGAAVGALGGAVGAIANNINTLRQIGGANESLAIRNDQNVQNVRSQVGNQNYVRDSNKSLTDYAARGDYQNQIAGINAKVRDSQFAAPSVAGQVGGEVLNMIFGGNRVELRFKMIDDAHLTMIGDYWLRYGYAVSRFAELPQNLKCMTKFTYWKLAETYFRSATIPEAFKQAIRGIFEKGVTVWSNPDDIGRIDMADNEPLEGIVL